MTDNKYEMETEYRDVETIRQALDLEGQPIDVEFVGRNIGFKIPVPVEEDDNGD